MVKTSRNDYNNQSHCFISTQHSNYATLKAHSDKLHLPCLAVAIENEFTRTRARFTLGEKLCPLFYIFFS